MIGLYLSTAQGLAQTTAPAPSRFGLSLEPEERLRYETRSRPNYTVPGASDPQAELSRLRLGLRWKDRAGWSAFLQPQYSYSHTHGVAGSTGTTHDLEFHQGYLDIQRKNSRWRLGRQDLIYGDSRLLGNADWNNLGRSWDAAKLTLTDSRATTDLFLGKLGQSPSKTSEPVLAGIYSKRTLSKAHAADFYLLYKSDRVSGVTQDVWTLGTRPHFVFEQGWDATVEAAYQLGRNGVRPISAWATAAVVGYAFPGPSQLRCGLEYDYASGGNPTGAGGFHTFDQLYPTNHAHYGLLDYVGWRNMQEVRLSARVKPGARWLVTLDGHFFTLADARDFWYADNGRPVVGTDGKPLRDPTGAAGRDLGTEFDAVVSYTLSKSANLSVGYARFLPGDFVRRTNGGRADDSDWFYAQAYYTY
ncbi:MAG TPA: alginate export family protein [Chthonomonadaceae bacterium]|nr:alginate export family protein [Chthonomonadaceae bacterium]